MARFKVRRQTLLHGYTTEGTVNVGAFVPPAMKRDLVELAHQNRQPVSEEIRTALRRHLEAAGPPTTQQT